MGLTFCSERFEKRHQQTLLTSATYDAQQVQAAQVLNSEQPHLEQNNWQLTMRWADEFDVVQIGNIDLPHCGAK